MHPTNHAVEPWPLPWARHHYGEDNPVGAEVPVVHLGVDAALRAQSSGERVYSIRSLEALSSRVSELTQLQHLMLAAETAPELPAEICGLKHLQKLIVRGSGLTQLPEQLGLLRQLSVLDASECRLQRLPRSIGALDALRTLILEENRLQKLPEELGALEELRELDLAENVISHLPVAQGNFPRLRRLVLSSNPLEYLPSKLTELPVLQQFSISHCGRLPPSRLHSITAALVHLLSLEVDGLDFGPAALTLPPRLQHLRWCDAPRQRSKIEPHPELRELILRGHGQQKCPEWLKELPRLRLLDLGRNQIKQWSLGSSALPNLKSLSLSGNEFRTMPYMEIPLQTLDLYGNSLEQLPLAAIPSSLEVLNASYNDIRAISGTLSTGNALRELNLRDNHLRQLSLSGLHLQRLDLSGNPLKQIDLDSNSGHLKELRLNRTYVDDALIHRVLAESPSITRLEIRNTPAAAQGPTLAAVYPEVAILYR
ncbi:MAG: leucine-rich repeat domain-containing protein [Myxococcota bacterium]